MISAFRRPASLASKTLLQPTWGATGVRTLASLPHRRMVARGKKVTQVTPKAPVSRDVACALPLSVHEMDNDSLVTLSALEDFDARVEVLKRHIMATDGINYAEAEEKFKEIQSFNSQGLFFLVVPYQVGIAASLTAALASFPLCFHLGTVDWFNKHYVTTDVPPPEDLETWLEVGSWSWNWMEPPLGQISFVLLCLQFSRSQIQNLGIRPFTSSMKHRRAQRLIDAYPAYNSKVLADYSKAAGLSGGSMF
eukprot:CAMPEP_0194046518 /NCGR_PEP_ID=MMETSP0009_2-20130614/21422_1 /TAXON_ID=210454 /ORGANISM="Grammatophora oceanica, Strain CCMP 410" /LENGTH=250 /DNA_ID=CAMNT_0038691839 /DNA_START=43 /DNA_END=795 /DNA_ORIENTATION=+